MGDQVKISGKTFKLPVQRADLWTFSVRPGGWILAENKEGLRRRVAFSSVSQGWSASFRGHLWLGAWVNKERNVSTSSADDLVAQFPGKVRKVLVQSGSKVLEGDPLVLVEAMKMEFTIRAPFSGQVLQVRVQVGQQLSPGDRFVDLEAESRV